MTGKRPVTSAKKGRLSLYTDLYIRHEGEDSMGMFVTKHTPHTANIVLVHGLWADGSIWRKVVPLLQTRGHFVIVVQNHLISVSDDVAATRRILTKLAGPTILVGHSYGGFVISEAANNAPEVVGLVYISAYAPDEEETIFSIGAPFSPMEVYQHLLVDTWGFVWVEPDVFPQYFADNVDPAEARIMAISQVPVAASILETKAAPPAWKLLPSWFLISTNDQIIHPDAERRMAQRLKATTRELLSDHASPISHPDVVAELILAAVRGTLKG